MSAQPQGAGRLEWTSATDDGLRVTIAVEHPARPLTAGEVRRFAAAVEAAETYLGAAPAPALAAELPAGGEVD
jgi:hypothetical protein